MKKKGSNTDQENKASAATSGVVNGGQIVTQHSNGPASGGAGSPTAASTTNGNGTSQTGGAPTAPSPNGGASTANAGQNGANGQINSTSPNGTQ